MFNFEIKNLNAIKNVSALLVEFFNYQQTLVTELQQTYTAHPLHQRVHQVLSNIFLNSKQNEILTHIATSQKQLNQQFNRLNAIIQSIENHYPYKNKNFQFQLTSLSAGLSYITGTNWALGKYYDHPYHSNYRTHSKIRHRYRVFQCDANKLKHQIEDLLKLSGWITPFKTYTEIIERLPRINYSDILSFILSGLEPKHKMLLGLYDELHQNNWQLAFSQLTHTNLIEALIIISARKPVKQYQRHFELSLAILIDFEARNALMLEAHLDNGSQLLNALAQKNKPIKILSKAAPVILNPIEKKYLKYESSDDDEELDPYSLAAQFKL